VDAGTGIVLAAPRLLDSLPDLELPAGYELGGLAIGEGSQEVLTVESLSNPTVTDGRQIHKDRDSRRNVVLVVAIESPSGVWLVGPNPAGSMAGPLPVNQASRILQAGLEEPTALAARQRLIHLLAAVETNDDLAGVTNAGLFATHYLATSARERADWGEQVAAAQPLLTLRSSELIKGLGYQSEGLGAGALLLSTTGGPVHAVAVLMTDSEGFDAATASLGASPVQYGLAKAHQERVPWLIVLRGAQIRLYPVRPDFGVGRRSQAETYLELDLSVVDDRSEGFLPLIFAAGSLDEKGAVQELLEGSIRYATELGERLRDRVYEYVVPNLAVGVANELERLGQGDDLDAAYRITLKILFRLLFQAYAEDQGLLPYNRNDRYTRNSLTTQANDFVERPDRELDAGSHAIWDDLRQVWDVIDTGNHDWDVPAYNGGLFGTDPDFHPDGHLIDSMRLDDVAVGTALRHLLTDTTAEGDLGAVDFRSLSVREFGTIYEGLLESSLSRAQTDLGLGKNNAYVPTDNPDPEVHAGGIYFHNASGERKATGSYFTKPFAVEHLLERAIDPTLDEHLEKVRELLDGDKPAAAAEKFFDFKVADLAMGSGHFLIAAIDRIEVQMAAFLTDHPIPAINRELDRLEVAVREALGANADDYEIEPSALLRRQIARRCIYGIDINEVAVELARVAVWIHTFVPGLPMSSLDHTLVCANSLTGIGTIDEALDALEPNRKAGMPSLFAFEIEQALEDARRLLIDAANSSEATKAEVRQAAEAAAKAAEAAAPTRLLFDAAVAVRIGELAEVAGSAADIQHLASTDHVQQRIAVLNPGHMPFLFPEVFLRDNPGFDVVVGNPPFKEVVLEELDFWRLRHPGLKAMREAEQRDWIERLRLERPDLHAEFEEATAASRNMAEVLQAGPFPGFEVGDADLYKAFAWRFLQLLRIGGSVGVVTPRSLMAAKGSAEWRRRALLSSKSSLVTLKNTGEWVFSGVNPGYSFCLLVFRLALGDGPSSLEIWGRCTSRPQFDAEVAGRGVLLDLDDLESRSDDLLIPDLVSTGDASLFAKMIKLPSFREDRTDYSTSPVREFDVTNDRKRGLLTPDGDHPVYNHLNIGHFAFLPGEGEFTRCDWEIALAELRRRKSKGSRLARSAFYQMAAELGDDWVNDADALPVLEPRIAFRSIVHATNQRKVWAALVPERTPLTNAAPYLTFSRGNLVTQAFVLGMLNSSPCDWFGHLFVVLNLNYFILNSLPLPMFDVDCPIHVRAAALAATLATGGTTSGYGEWGDLILQDPPSQEEMIAEIDGIASILFGLADDELPLVWDGENLTRPDLAQVEAHRRTWLPDG
jgi:hypothetical protein